MPQDTPMMRQYNAIKDQHSDCILFFRLGDFYEMFDEDAKTASRELDLMLTTRDRGENDPEKRVPMCGVPYHSAEAYISRLIQRGYKVAICEQTEDPATAKGLVDRDVIRIVTPGTVTESSMLDESRSNYIGSCYIDAGGSAVCFADISTGEICARSFPPAEGARVLNELSRFSPAEVVLNEAAAENADIEFLLRERLRCLADKDESRFDYMKSTMRVAEQFSVASVDELGLENESQAVCAIGGLLDYIIDTQKTVLDHINKLDFYSDGRYMELDMETIRNLELIYTGHDRLKRGSLLWAMDKTKTPMGARLLRSWVSRPLLSPAAITRRQSAVAELFENNMARGEIRQELKDVGDIERLIGRIVYGTGNARDLRALQLSLEPLERAVSLLAPFTSTFLSEIRGMDLLTDLRNAIGTVIADDPPFSVREGNMIRSGYDSEVDRLRDLLGNSSAALSSIEARERQRTGKKLKVGYNKVFGYYIEIPRSQSADVPEDYIRKQTLVNGERFITEELKNLETELLSAKDRIADLEYSIFNRLRESVAREVLRIQDTARKTASLDVLASLAECAVSNGWVRPDITDDGVIDISDGRHPVVELMQKETLFVPNDARLGGLFGTAAVITGPNMAGKSTYMRQTALIVLMAQMGSFVPARRASIGIVDRVFTRIGASDDLTAGRSTFMVEMTEVANILKNATFRSLLILDEIGRGTSTYDGMAIARAVVEYCADKKTLGAKTMFATHYHELTALEGEVDGVKNYNITAKKRGGSLIFLRKIVPGGADDSYGIEVASLAGVPTPVIKRAGKLLSELTSGHFSSAPLSRRPSIDEAQFSLESIAGEEALETLRSTDLNTITPIEAMNLLFTLKKKVTE
ncbi:MAG: DNA mismatch repair protein MutS [Oscillospiraceae bacterium]|nr:DNA mismatch repair protein MutS [Oscillospiraceae bacterium]